MKQSIRHEYLARHIVDGKCAASVQRVTLKQAVADLGTVVGGKVELFQLQLTLDPVGKWWKEINRVRVEGGAA